MKASLGLRAAMLSLLIFAAIVLIWQVAAQPAASTGAAVDPEYAKLVGAAAATGQKSAMPTPADIGATIWKQLQDPFYVRGSNDKGIALYTIKDSAISSIFVIFICSVWPMLINTAFGVGGVRREWLNVARTLEVGPLRTAFKVILPAAAPTIMTGMRISIGIAWLVIVAAEMLVGGTGIGYFVWNEWNNLSIANIVTAILLIGLVGLLLDQALGWLARLVTYPE